MKLFKKKMNVIRFGISGDMNPDTVEGICSSLAENAFVEYKQEEVNEGFTTMEDPYGGDNFTPDNIIQSGKLLCGVFRRDSKSVPSSIVEREFEKKYAGQTLSRTEKKELKKEIKDRLFLSIPYKTVCAPFIYNVEKKEGFIFSVSGAIIDSFEFMFSNVLGADISLKGFGGSYDARFLSWLWWKVDTNHYGLPDSRYCEVNGKIRVSSTDGIKVSAQGAQDEIKLTLNEGCKVVSMEIFLDEFATFCVDAYGGISGLGIRPEDIPSEESPSLFPIYSQVTELYEYMDECKEMFIQQEGEKELAKGMKTWIMPSICTQSLDDI